MKTITATDFKNRAAQVIKEVSASGKAIVVTRRGRPVVRVEPMDAGPKPIRLGALKHTLIHMGDIVSPVFDEWGNLDPRDNKPGRRSR